MNDIDVIAEAVRLLEQRYRAIHERIGRESLGREWTGRIESLALTAACCDRVRLDQHRPDRPLQIVVLGPTQAGKSTVVNLLIGRDAAQVSPLAGHTIHPQGFPINLHGDSPAWIDDFFPGRRRLKPAELPRGQYDCFGLADPIEAPDLPAAVIWDTPDFDSVDADHYRASVLRTVVLADLCILVLSKEKYADQSVWSALRLLAPLAQAWLIILNKTAPNQRPTLTRALAEKWQTERNEAIPELVTLPYHDTDDPPSHSAWQDASRGLLPTVANGLRSVHRRDGEHDLQRLIRGHWDAWLEPIRCEWAALDDWERCIEREIEAALLLYRRDYLDHPQHYETFQRALAALLRLLEIPGLAGAMFAARQVVTWPLRQLARVGRLGAGRHGKTDREAAILEQIADHVWIRLNEQAIDRPSGDPAVLEWWAVLSQRLRMGRPEQRTAWSRQIANYQSGFQPCIDESAERLYARLQEHPALLNGLRATRFGADAAALAAALHTGGIGLHDFILAPAVLSVTSLLAESALGRYLQRAEIELKERQLAAVEQLLRGELQQQLRAAASRIEGDRLFSISRETLQEAETLLQAARHA